MKTIRKALGVAVLGVVLAGGGTALFVEHDRGVAASPAIVEHDRGVAESPAIVEHDRGTALEPAYIEHDRGLAYIPSIEHDRN